MAQRPSSHHDASVIISNPLRKKIGRALDLATVFTPEKIRRCQEMADKMLLQLVQEIETQLVMLGEEYMKASEEPQHSAAVMQRGIELSFMIRKRMETLNYPFGYETATSLYDYLKDKTHYNSDVMLIVCKHIAVLHIIIKENIRDGGGEMGRKLLVNLKALIDKTHV